MELGVVFPTTEVGTDPEVIRRYARTVEDAGYTHLHTFDHVVGIDPARPGFDGQYDYRDAFHEPFTLFAHLAAVTDRIDLVTGILVLPQRQATLAAKQAAEVDVLSGGRMKLGVGVGWNEAEYDALGMEFEARGRRMEEQVELLRALWANELVEFRGEWHHVLDAGINPRPAQGSIPVLFGGGAEVVLQRTVRMGDGWIVPAEWKRPSADIASLAEQIESLEASLQAVDRDPTAFEVLGRTALGSRNPDQWADRAREWATAGASHLAVTTMGLGLETPQEHIDVALEWKATIDESSVPVE